jgi:predicted porin
MNQKLVALAVVGALSAPGLALAQATTSGTNVQVYGLFDVRGDYMKLSNGTAGTGQVSKTHLGTGAPNRIGFRGTESLGGGLTAFFQVETQVFTDARLDGASAAHTNATLGGRPTFVGLRGGWGDLSVGYQESVYKDVYQTTWSVNPDNAMFGAIMGNGNTTGSVPTPNCNGLTASGTNALLAAAGTTNCTEAEGSPTAFNRTMSDSVTYRSPVISGFRFSAMMTANEFKAPNSAVVAGTNQVDPRFGAYSLTWSAGPLSLAGAYEQHTGFRATNTAAFPNNQAKDKGLTLGARFNYGAGLIGAGYEQLKYENTAAAAAADNHFTLKNWIVQATFNLTPSDVLFGGYSKTNGQTSCGAGIATCGSQSGAKFMTIGVDHAFSKRTAVYAYWSKIDNNSAATYNYLSDSRNTSNGSGSSSGLIAGQDSTSYNVGVKHSF